MRHAVFGRRLSRDTNARKALLNNLASSVLEKGQITTTLAKAKFARLYIEKLITSAKKERLFVNRQLASFLTNSAFSKLVSEIAPGFSTRLGGYTRVIKLENRKGDAAPMARLELLEWEKVQKKEKPIKKKPILKVKKVKQKQTKSKLSKSKEIKK